MRSYTIRVGPKSSDQCPHRGENAKKYIEGRNLCQNEGREYSYVVTYQGMLGFIREDE